MNFRAKKKILIADPDEELLNRLKKYEEASIYEIETAKNGH